MAQKRQASPDTSRPNEAKVHKSSYGNHVRFSHNSDDDDEGVSNPRHSWRQLLEKCQNLTNKNDVKNEEKTQTPTTSADCDNAQESCRKRRRRSRADRHYDPNRPYWWHGTSDWSLASNVNYTDFASERTISTSCLQTLHATMSYSVNVDGTTRQWEKTEFSSSETNNTDNFKFTVMTYNVLAQELISENHHLYSDCSPDVLAWEARKERLFDEITQHQPDVVCLQEVQKDHYLDFFKPRLAVSGFEGYYKKRTGNKRDGCATFVRTDKFTIDSVYPVEYRRSRLLDRDNVALITKITPKAQSRSGKSASIIIANTHLLFNPRRGDVKLGQLCVLMAEIDRVLQTDKNPAQSNDKSINLSKKSVPLNDNHNQAKNNCIKRNNTDGKTSTKSSDTPVQATPTSPPITSPPIILCGDLNSEPYSDLYRFIVDGHINHEYLEIACISGQREGRMSSTARFLQHDFPPSSLNISKQCQYVVDEETTKTPNPETSDYINGNNPIDQESHLQHQLKLASVYTHRVKRSGEPEVTTQHGRTSCAVDYIFYSQNSGVIPVERYGLLSRENLGRMSSLPNNVFPSDHLCLLAKFVIQ